MKIVIFGLTISSSWGNGHATLWRGLCRALSQLGHSIIFFERDVPYYAMNRDLTEVPGGKLILYSDWSDALQRAKTELADADIAMTTSYCPDGIAATELLTSAPRAIRIFYDLDTPVTLSRLGAGESTSYIGANGLRDFDLVLSYTGGRALDRLRSDLGARHVAPLYGHVDPNVHHPVPPVPRYASDLSYLGTYAEDRQIMLQRLFIDAADQRPKQRFLIGGAQYPQSFPWKPNIYFTHHLPPSEHPAFFSSSRLTLNVTRLAMAEMGWCPSGRLFEAASCATAILSDAWAGIDQFFEPGREILLATTAAEAVATLDIGDRELERIRRAGRDRVLSEHTSAHRALEFERLINSLPRTASANSLRTAATEV